VNRLRLTVAILALSAATASAALAAGDYTLYEPRPTESSTPPASPEEGLLVRNIVIRKGDTLWGLASKYRGKGSYYPQFLILNNIADPDLIYAGKVIHVPVTPDRPVAPRHRRARAGKPAAVSTRHTEHAAPSAVPVPRHREAPTSVAQPAPRVQTNAESEQRLFEAASRAYKTGDCKEALERFDRFLNRYPSSPLAADVSLYKADCYMKLSGQ
jgi:hypothetical protein